jgi:hypothetical protein
MVALIKCTLDGTLLIIGTRYLEILEKENKIRQSGKTGKGVMYTKI